MTSLIARYHPLTRFFHWAMAALVLGALVLGLLETAIPLHKALGISVLIFLPLRVVVRLLWKAPALPASFKSLEVRAAKLGHLGLYLLMVAIPLTGYAMSSAAGKPVYWFGVDMPPIVTPDKALAKQMHEVHELLATALMLLLALHVLAVVKHLLVEKTNLLKRMT